MKTQRGTTETKRQILTNATDKKVKKDDLDCIKAENAHRKSKEVKLYDKHKFLESHLQQLDEIINNIA